MPTCIFATFCESDKAFLTLVGTYFLNFLRHRATLKNKLSLFTGESNDATPGTILPQEFNFALSGSLFLSTLDATSRT
jgi:hypothetical protein